MNGLEKITARIEADARSERETIVREGEAGAARIREEYEAKAKAAAAAAKAAGDEAAQRQLERLESAAQMDAKKQLLKEKQSCIDEAFAQAQKKLLDLPENKYADLLARMAAKASASGREEIILSQRDHDRIGEQVVSKANALLAASSAPAPEEMGGSRMSAVIRKMVGGGVSPAQSGAQLTLAEETRDMAGGLTLRDGNVEVNCAFETQLRVLRESMAAEIAGILFA